LKEAKCELEKKATPLDYQCVQSYKADGTSDPKISFWHPKFGKITKLMQLDGVERSDWNYHFHKDKVFGSHQLYQNRDYCVFKSPEEYKSGNL
jgi:hypothetical protein